MSDNAHVTVMILAAGAGKRMKRNIPKVLNKIAGLSLLGHVLDMAQNLSNLLKLKAEIHLILSPENQKKITAAFPNFACHIQKQTQGTGGALISFARENQDKLGEKILILYGDTPFITCETAAKLLQMAENGIAVLGFYADNPAAYGRLIIGENNQLQAIIEAAELKESQKNIDLCNAGIMAINTAHLLKYDWLGKLSNQNASGEYYLTDLVALANACDVSVQVAIAEQDEVLGVNSLAELAHAEKLWQQNRREFFMARGVMMQDPESIFFAHDTEIAADVVLDSSIYFGEKVKIAASAHIRSFCHIEGAMIGKNAVIGPFARIRPTSEIGDDSRIGNFVEVKNSQLAGGVKAGHLSYLGDSEIGSGSNIGAGTITCNYDGFGKAKTVLGANVFIGSNSALVAPVQIDDDALIAAGSVISKNVEKNTLALTRSSQTNLIGKGMKARAQQHKNKKRQD